MRKTLVKLLTWKTFGKNLRTIPKDVSPKTISREQIKQFENMIRYVHRNH
jgi:hypothetical protein